MTMLGIYIIDRLAPSSQLVQKMQPQSKSPTHGNDRIASALVPGYEQKHQSFCPFFATQDPLMVPLSKEKCPNFKVDEFFRWLRHIWKEAKVLAEDFSIDEQTTKCHGKCEYKTRCGKFKRIGNGLLMHTSLHRDQKPFYMILHSCESIPWTPIFKWVWSTALKQNVDFSFLRWNLLDEYNFEMNDNDVANQL
jgi:hypothetical protein